MKLFSKTLILSHRYLGIAISLLVVVWFGSGIVMMYAGGMPTLAPETRLARISDVDTSRIRLSLAEAAEKAGFDAAAGWGGGRVVLLSIMDRPAYRFGGEATVFADTGEMLTEVSPGQAQTIAAKFMDLPADKVRQVATMTEVDQWTLNQRRLMPLYKFAVEDGLGTELYIPASTGEVSMLTTSRQRLFAYLGVIPHWLYFTPLRVQQPLWYDIMVWTSTLACVLAVIGIVIGFIKLRWTRPFKWSTAIPYAGWMRWHYITGMVFGVTTLTFPSAASSRWSPMSGRMRAVCLWRATCSPVARSILRAIPRSSRRFGAESRRAVASRKWNSRASRAHTIISCVRRRLPMS